MKFRNVKTGAVIEAPSMLGGNWELISGQAPVKQEPVAVVPAPVEEKAVKPVKKTKKTTKKTTK